jgi:hypothetical protein
MFSKAIVISVAILAAIISAYTVVITAVYGDLSPLHVLIPAVFGQFGVTAGFYFNKAKAENQIKLRGWDELDNADLESSDIEDGRDEADHEDSHNQEELPNE